MSVSRPVTGLIALCLIVGACSGSGAPASAAPSEASSAPSASATASPSASPSASPTAKPTPSSTPTPTPVPSAAAFSLDSTVWWSGYVIHVTGGTYDPLKRILKVEATFMNTATAQTEVSQVGNDLKVVWNGQFMAPSVSPGPVPVGATASAEISLQVPKDFTVADTVLAFGAPDEHQALVPLNGDPATSDQPTSFTVSGTAKMGKYAAFAVNKGLVIPAACSGYPDRIKYGPLKKGEVSIVLWGVATNSAPLNDAYMDQGFIAVPDGTTATSNPAVGYDVFAKGTIRTDGMCFDVPAPGSGSYKLTMHEQRSKASGSMTFVVP
jgi:hypothetical protein